MKKKIFLYGNTNRLGGVKVDLSNYYNFFRSDAGGAWEDYEIDIQHDLEKDKFINKINSLKNDNLDYLIFVFSGHGAWERQTILEINSKEETVKESQITGLAQKQLTILDCCRSTVNQLQKTASLREFSLYNKVNTRDKYEEYIKNACKQNSVLYACSVGETAYDTNLGGVYTVELLSEAKEYNSSKIYKTISECHSGAKLNVQSKYHDQNPDALLPRCLTSKELIFSLNPNKLVNLIS